MEPSTTLEPGYFNGRCFVLCKDGELLVLDRFAEQLELAVKNMMNHGLVKQNDSFGFSVSIFKVNQYWRFARDWNEPRMFVHYLQHWGPNGPRYSMNAIRKQRASLRISANTLDIVRNLDEGEFIDVIESVDEHGNFTWGDFPYGGCVIRDCGEYTIVFSCSALTQEQDDTVSHFGAGALDSFIAEHGGLNTVTCTTRNY